MMCLLAPRLYFSSPKCSIGPAWPDIPWSRGSGRSLLHSILQPSKKCLFSGMLFWCLFSGIGSQTGPEMWWKVSLCDHPGDAMLQYVVIFSNLVFERPYNVLAAFSNVSWARGAKKRSTKTLETYLAARCEKNTLRNHKNHRKHKKRPQLRTRLAPRPRTFAGILPLVCLCAAYGRQNLKNMRKDLPRVPKHTKMMQPMLPKCPRVVSRLQK